MAISDPALSPLDRRTAQEVIERLRPGLILDAVTELPGSFSNSTTLVTARGDIDDLAKLVVRRYRCDPAIRAQRARSEFHALTLLEGAAVPAPPPLMLDEAGSVLSTPGIVTGYKPGRQTIAPVDDPEWVRKLAHTLADIHAVRCEIPHEALLDANSEALYFLKGGTVAGYMEEHPDGPTVWNVVREASTSLKKLPPVLIHLDYWPGNVLWEEKTITAVVDWEEAGYGDPAVDVGYARKDLFGAGLRQQADEFLEAYEARAGCKVENLAFWELAAAPRAMPDPGRGVRELRELGRHSVSKEDLRRNHREFIDSAIRRL
ncbi:MAG: phosphotransferase family protein [Chloroflexota bacterium]